MMIKRILVLLLAGFVQACSLHPTPISQPLEYVLNMPSQMQWSLELPDYKPMDYPFPMPRPKTSDLPAQWQQLDENVMRELSQGNLFSCGLMGNGYLSNYPFQAHYLTLLGVSKSWVPIHGKVNNTVHLQFPDKHAKPFRYAIDERLNVSAHH